MKGFRISKNDRHTVKCVRLLFFNVQNLEILFSRSASPDVFNCYLMLREKKRKRNEAKKEKKELSFSCSQKTFCQALSCIMKHTVCVLGSYLNLQMSLLPVPGKP